MSAHAVKEAVRISIGAIAVDADLHVPDRATGLVVFAHGSGSSRVSRRNRAVATALESSGFGTLLLDLLTADEESVDECGGRPDLAGQALPHVQAPTLLIVGGQDEPVIEMNRDAMRLMRAPVELEIVPAATHLFEERGALEQVTSLASDISSARRNMRLGDGRGSSGRGHRSLRIELSFKANCQ